MEQVLHYSHIIIAGNNKGEIWRFLRLHLSVSGQEKLLEDEKGFRPKGKAEDHRANDFWSAGHAERFKTKRKNR
jgi:hypothetical protein